MEKELENAREQIHNQRVLILSQTSIIYGDDEATPQSQLTDMLATMRKSRETYEERLRCARNTIEELTVKLNLSEATRVPASEAWMDEL